MDMPMLDEAVDTIERMFKPVRADAALILGSGWGEAFDDMEVLWQVPYGDIPAMGAPGVAGHRGRLLLARIGSRRVLIFQGRRHWYEGLGWTPIALPVYMAIRTGARAVIITNAAGGLNPAFIPGDLMLVRDHVNAMGANPLIGPHHAVWGDRFPDLSRLYDANLCASLRKAADAAGIVLRDGVYLAVPGPVYETPAEVRLFREAGADAVGMSTVPEAILAGAAGLRVAALSCITNPAVGIGGPPLRHGDVLETTRRTLPVMRTLLTHTLIHADL